jgi:predicted RNA-binding Zn-ribbon protein involved in translation (DUF1610 family)
MHALVSCVRCQRQLRIAEENFGQSVTCTCGATFVAQDLEPVADETPDPSASRQTAADPRPLASEPSTKKTVLTSSSGEEVVTVRCSSCNKKLGVESSWLGKTVKCPRCGTTFVARGSGPRRPAKPTILRGGRQEKGAAPESAIPLEKPELVQPEAPPRPAPRPAAEYTPAGSNPELNGVWSNLATPEAYTEASPLPETAGTPASRPAPPKPKAPGKFTTLQQEMRKEAQEEVGKGFPPVSIPLVVHDDPEGKLYGKLAARMTQEGLYLRQGGQAEFLVRVGSPAEHLDGDTFSVVIDTRRVKLAVVKWFADRERLAKDVVAVLNGERKWLMASTYSMPWTLLVPPLLPLGIPLLALPRYVAEQKVLEGAASVALAGALVATCLWVTQKQTWPVAKRLRVGLGAVLGGYLLLALALIARPGPPAPPVWKEVPSEKGGYTVKLLIHPQDTHQETSKPYRLPSGDEVTLHEMAVTLQQPRLTLAVAYFDVTNRHRLKEEFFGELRKSFNNEFPVGDVEPGREIPVLQGSFHGRDFKFINLEGGDKALRRVYLVRGRVYFLTARGDFSGHEDNVNRFLNSFNLAKPQLLQLAQIETVVSPFLTAAFHPDSGTAFTVNRELLAVLNYGPAVRAGDQFVLRQDCTLERPGYQAVFDPNEGLLYVAVSSEIETASWGSRRRQLGRGPIHVYDVNPALKRKPDLSGKFAQAKLSPIAILNTNNAKVASLLLSPNREQLYYLDVANLSAPKAWRVEVARIKQEPDREREPVDLNIAFELGTEAIALSPDGKTLFSIAAPKRHFPKKPNLEQGYVQVTALTGADPKPRSVVLDVDPVDLAVTEHGYAFLTSGKGTEVLVINVDLLKPPCQPCARGVPEDCYLTLSPDGRRLYLADTKAVYPWLIDEPYVEDNTDMGKPAEGEAKKPVSGPLFASPDGKYLLCPTGTVFNVVGN